MDVENLMGLLKLPKQVEVLLGPAVEVQETSQVFVVDLLRGGGADVQSRDRQQGRPEIFQKGAGILLFAAFREEVTAAEVGDDLFLPLPVAAEEGLFEFRRNRELFDEEAGPVGDGDEKALEEQGVEGAVPFGLLKEVLDVDLVPVGNVVEVGREGLLPEGVASAVVDGLYDPLLLGGEGLLKTRE